LLSDLPKRTNNAELITCREDYADWGQVFFQIKCCVIPKIIENDHETTSRLFVVYIIERHLS